MVTYVQNKLINVTITVDISIIGFNVHCMRPARYQSAVHLHFALEKRCATSLRRFSQSEFNFFFFFFLWVDCASFMCDWDKPRSTKTTNLERVLYLCITLDWRWSDVLLASTFIRGKTLTFLRMQKMCALIDAHKK